MALKHPKIVSFSTLTETPAIKSLSKDAAQKKLFEVLGIFQHEDISSYDEWYNKNEEACSLNQDDCRAKMRYLTLCSLAQENNEITFAQVTTSLKIDQSDIEEWIIEAIVGGNLDAKIDQEKETLTVHNFTRRAAKDQAKEFGSLKSKIEKVESDYGAILNLIRPQ